MTDYHVHDDVNTKMENPYPGYIIEHLLYRKNWIDSVQWHLEDIIRDRDIDPVVALQLKRRIDHSNQERTELVEYIDNWFLQQYKEVKMLPGAGFNTESPAWAIDRLSILALKIYHMGIETVRKDATPEHRKACGEKLAILTEQQKDLSQAIDQLISDIATGNRLMKVYRQMKMYNDETLNPVLYQHKK
jgi:hypothetical protein